MTAVDLWLPVLIGLPLLVVIASFGRISVESLRRLAITCGMAALVWACLAFTWGALDGWSLHAPAGLGSRGEPWLRLDPLSRPLPALAAALWLLTLTVTPRTSLERAGLRRTAAATVFTSLSFLSEQPILLFAMWLASLLTLRSALVGAGSRTSTLRAVFGYLTASTVAFGVGALLISIPGSPAPAREIGLWLIVAAALVRKGIFPCHAWLPAMFEHAPLGPAVLFSSPQLGTYAVAVLVLPRATPELASVVAVLALVTAAYGATLALVQRSARRACGYLFMSQSALVLAGLDSSNEEGLAGALLLWLSSSLAFAGLARCVLVVEARRGALDLSRHHGGYESMPLVAASFLMLGLTCTGFPGTLGFVGEELLLAGAVRDFPLLGYLLVVAGALTGLAILRMYFSLFCGAPDTSVRLKLRPREAVGFAAVVGSLVICGLVPGWLVASRLTAGRDLLEARAANLEARPVRPASRWPSAGSRPRGSPSRDPGSGPAGSR